MQDGHLVSAKLARDWRLPWTCGSANCRRYRAVGERWVACKYRRQCFARHRCRPVVPEASGLRAGHWRWAHPRAPRCQRPVKCLAQIKRGKTKMGRTLLSPTLHALGIPSKSLASLGSAVKTARDGSAGIGHAGLCPAPVAGSCSKPYVRSADCCFLHVYLVPLQGPARCVRPCGTPLQGQPITAAVRPVQIGPSCE